MSTTWQIWLAVMLTNIEISIFQFFHKRYINRKDQP